MQIKFMTDFTNKYTILFFVVFGVLILSCRNSNMTHHIRIKQQEKIEKQLMQQTMESYRISVENNRGNKNFNVYALMHQIELRLIQTKLLKDSIDRESYLNLCYLLNNDSTIREKYIKIVENCDVYFDLISPTSNCLLPHLIYSLYDVESNKYIALTLLGKVLRSEVYFNTPPCVKDYETYFKQIDDYNFRKRLYRFPILLEFYNQCRIIKMHSTPFI
jgi:hypothetical protein